MIIEKLNKVLGNSIGIHTRIAYDEDKDISETVLNLLIAYDRAAEIDKLYRLEKEDK